MSLFLIFLLTLPFWVSSEDFAQGCAWVLILMILIPVALLVLGILGVVLAGILIGGFSLAEWIGDLF